jgi:copper chaperone CopZ
MSTSVKTTNGAPIQRVTLPLYNVDCASDAQTIERILQQLPGVMTVYANPASEKVYIEYDGAHTDRTRLRAALDQAGYGQQGLQVTCGHCEQLSGDTATTRQEPKRTPRRWWPWQ